jgi:hypothetical protein
MRHFLTPGPVATLPLGMGQAAPAAVLVTLPGGTSGLLPRRRGASLAVTIAPVAARTDHYLTATAGAVEQAGRIAHRQFLPMSPGWPPTSGRYLPTARAMHAPGCGTGEDCGGRYQCRTCLNGTDPLDHGAVLVTPESNANAAPLPLAPSPPSPPNDQRVFTALVGDCLRHPPTMRGFPQPSTAVRPCWKVVCINPRISPNSSNRA